VIASFPQEDKNLKDKKAEKEMKYLQGAIIGVRTIRAENRIPPRQKIELWIKVKKDEEKRVILDNQTYIQTLANIRKIETLDQFPDEKKLMKGIAGSWEIAIPIEEGVFNLEQEKQRLDKELAKIAQDSERIEKRLQNTDFRKRAPKNVIQETKGRLQELQAKKAKLEESLEHILSLI
jgi:valyl-tRNA synthetase